MEMIYFGDHDPIAPQATPMVLSQLHIGYYCAGT